MRLKTQQLQNLIQGVKAADPAMYQTLNGIIESLNTINNDLWPIVDQIVSNLGLTANPIPDDVTGFTLALPGNTLRFRWDPADSASFYEIRVGATWNTAALVTKTINLLVDLQPIVAGTYTYWIAGISPTGDYSENPTSLTFTIHSPGQPTVTVTVIDNSVLLHWTQPTSDFTIAYYKLYRGATLIGTIYGTFAVVQETNNGTFTYSITAYDIVGNAGVAGTITTVVNQPPDYEMQDDRISTFAGTKTNCKLDGIKLLATVDLTKTYQVHFTGNSWAGPSAQVSAGYPYWLTPSLTTGSYVETINYGTLLTNVIANISYGTQAIVGTVTVATKMRTSTDNITWSGWSSGTSIFAASMQYLQIEMDFTSGDADSLAYIYSLEIRVDVKREVDSGNCTVHAADAAGTVVYFNKTFKEVDSITLGPDSTIPGYAVLDFTSIPNPVSFKAYFFDNSGIRQDSPIYWKARGIV